MKNLYIWLSLSLVFVLPLASQTLAYWPLGPSDLTAPKVIGSGVLATHFERGNGLGGLQFSGSGVATNSWALNPSNEAQVDYYEFGVEALPGQTIELTELSFAERRSSSGPRDFSLVYSKDGFANEQLIASFNMPDNINVRNHSFPFSIKIADGEQLEFRLYAYHAESTNGSWTIRKNSLRLSGAPMPACSVPQVSSIVTISNLNPSSFDVNLEGNSAQGRLLVLAPDTYDLPIPYQGEQYTGSLSYGTGEHLGKEAYVLASSTAAQTSFSITDLTPGAVYQLLVYEYNASGMCYNLSAEVTDVIMPCSDSPEQVKELRYTSLDSRVAISWLEPNCYDRYLVLASEQPINLMPSTPSFSASTTFGEGQPLSGYATEVYPVLHSSSNEEVIVDGLNNGQTYYFAVYARNGYHNGQHQWSDPITFSSTPQEACPRQDYERIFINEIHYVNEEVSQDQGVEIAGPAGIDLSNYELTMACTPASEFEVVNPTQRYPLNAVIDDEGDGFGAVWFPLPDLPEQAGMVKLWNKTTGEIIDYLIYDTNTGLSDQYSNILDGGVLNPPSAFPPVVETDDDPVGYSLQRIGEGNCAIDYVWTHLPHSRGVLNMGQAVLPVLLTELGAEAKGEAARIFWQTALEANSDFFAVEHSVDGREFKQIGKVKAAGNSSEVQQYQFWDYTPQQGINYYRLKQIDFDGTSYDHGIVSVRFDGKTAHSLFVYPNPVDKQASIRWQGKAQSLKLRDNNGRLLRQIELNEAQEGGHQSMDVSTLPTGTYFLLLESRDRVESFTIVKA